LHASHHLRIIMPLYKRAQISHDQGGLNCHQRVLIIIRVESAARLNCSVLTVSRGQYPRTSKYSRACDISWACEPRFVGSVHPKNQVQLFEYLAVLRYVLSVVYQLYRSLAKYCTTWGYHLWGRYPRSLCDFQVLLPPNSDPSGTIFSKATVCVGSVHPRTVL
jgi:hypothetical protein